MCEDMSRTIRYSQSSPKSAERLLSVEPPEIDPVKYGVLWERVQNLDKKIDRMELQLEQLLELANRSKGGFWMGMTIASMVGAVVTWVVSHFKG
jgi:hypothetical protein